GGPLPVEDNGDFGRWLIEKGEEWGTRSRRRRRGGPLDLPAMKRGLRGLGVKGIDSIALLKMDVLSQLPEVPVCVAWDIEGKLYFTAPTFDPEVLKRVKPVIRTLKGWDQDISRITRMQDLPPEAANFILMVQNELGLPIELIGTGRHRDHAIYPRGEVYRYDTSQLDI
ncbi:adenylosuccinate synthetase, partial [Candidatus Gottesmanbacteria bacterium]|nr:adenylosuccinate synthetase [Candidatus Gottesmanbacteria bacterium]